MIDDIRFTQPLYTIADAARLVGMSPSTLSTWARGYRREFPDRPPVKQGPVITALDGRAGLSLPFVGLIEATVVQAFRQTGLPMPRIRRAIEVLASQGELQHALASRRLYSDGAQVLYDYAKHEGDSQLRLLTVVGSGQRVFHEVIDEYLSRIGFDKDTWATELIVPVTPHPILRVRPKVAGGQPLFIVGGAPWSAVLSRRKAGESVESIARDYGVNTDDVEEALDSLAPTQLAA